MNTYGVVKDIAKFDMSAKNTTIYIFVVVFSDVCRLEILVSVSSLLPSENSIAGIGFSDSQADPLLGGCNHDGWNAAEYIFHTLKLASRFPHLISVLVLVSFLLSVTNSF